jgi:hypothetical protein
MLTIYRTKADDLDVSFVEALKSLFGGREVDIIVRPTERKPGQEWFWTAEWQEAEREVEEDLAAGRYETFDTIDEFIASLETAA